MKNNLFYLLLVAMCLPFVNISAQNVNLSNYTLDWSDEFNGSNSDFDKNWISMNKNLDGWHLAGRWRENVEIHNGILEIYNKKEKRGSNDWTSGSVWTKKQFSYGYYECKYMYAAATGVNNSFWLWPKTKTYPEYDNYEIDINEGHYVNDISTNVHNWSDTWVNAKGKTKHTIVHKSFTMDGANLGKEYHVYGFEWSPKEMKWYFDGKLIRTEANKTNHGPTNILLSSAILSLEGFVGPVTDSIDGTSMKVDYVRYYRPQKEQPDAFPYKVTEEAKNRNLSAAMKRSFNNYPSPFLGENELYSQFKYTRIKGFDYNDNNGTITRRDPSKIIFENGKYYVYYTKRHTSVKPIGGVWTKGYQNTPPKNPRWNDTIPSVDWDLCEIWYATSKDGFNWEEQGVAVKRPAKPTVGWRSVATPDILKFKGKYYLYYQAFVEAPGTRGDYCPVGVSYSDSPDGPWTTSKEVAVDTGRKGEWDQFAVQDPTPLVHNGKIYIYYKGAFNRPNTVWVALGLATSDNPLGPFKKCPQNPVVNSGHELCFFPFKEGVAGFAITDGNEHFTVQYAKDWVNFEIASITEMMPLGGNAYVPDAFTDSSNGRGITWGLCFFRYSNDCSYLARFDCDLSLDVNDPEMKKHQNPIRAEEYFKKALSAKQLKRILKK